MKTNPHYIPLAKRTPVPASKCKRPGRHRTKGGVCLDCTSGARSGEKRSAAHVARDRNVYNPNDMNVKMRGDYFER